MSEKLSLRKQKFLDTQNRLYLAGLKLFQTVGYKDCDLRTICKEAGIGLGTFYNYFQDKLSLYLYVFEKEFISLCRIVLDKEEMEKLKSLDKRELVDFIVNYQMGLHKHTSLFYREAELLLIQEPKVGDLKKRLLNELLISIKELFSFLNISLTGSNLEVKLSIINNTIEETIYLIIDKDLHEQKIFLKELSDFVYSYIF